MPKSDGYKNLIPPVKGEIRNPKGRGNSKSVKTILDRFLNLTMKQKNPFTQEDENMTVSELMTLKQIANALEGDLQAYKELIDRYEGKIQSKVDVTTDGDKFEPNVIQIGYGKKDEV